MSQQQDKCFCGPEFWLMSCSGGAAPEGLYGRVTINVDGMAQDYVRHGPAREMPKQQEASKQQDKSAQPVAHPDINLSDPAVQKRLAAQWGYVPAQPTKPMTDFELEYVAIAAGMDSALNMGSGSCVRSEGCNGVTQEHLRRFAELVQAGERERCAKICEGVREAADNAARDGHRKAGAMSAAETCAKLIRSA